MTQHESNFASHGLESLVIFCYTAPKRPVSAIAHLNVLCQMMVDDSVD